MTSFNREPAATVRVPVERSPENGLRKTSFIMVEKLFTVPRNDLGKRVGQLTDDQMHAVSRALVKVLGIAPVDVL